jgi:hypothetical protein
VAARFNIWMQIRSTEDTGSESSIAGVRWALWCSLVFPRPFNWWTHTWVGKHKLIWDEESYGKVILMHDVEIVNVIQAFK